MIAPRWAALMAVCLSLTACHAASDGHAPGNVVVDGRIDQQAVARFAAQYHAMDTAHRKAEFARRDRQVERQLWTLSGLEQALGGAAKADEVFNGLSDALARRFANLDPKTIVFTPASLRRTGPGEAFGFGIVAGVEVASAAAAGAVLATNDGSTGRSRSGAEITADVQRNEVSVATAHQVEYGGADLTIKTTAAVPPCPDTNGRLELSGTVDLTIAMKGGGAGYHVIVDVTVDESLNDDAEVADVQRDYRVQMSGLAGSSATFVELSASRGGQPSLVRSGGGVTDSFRGDAVYIASVVADSLAVGLDLAAWSGYGFGRCVVLKPTVSAGPSGLTPGSSVTIAAAPRSKIDGGPVGGSVTATLTAGEASVSPSGTKVRADATFTYKAPGQKDKTGTVALEARSKRGVANATIAFDTKAGGYLADGGQGDFHGTGTICDFAKPFTISGSGLTLTFTPASDTAGTYSLAGTAGGAPWTGSGRYVATFSADRKTGSLDVTGKNYVHSPIGVFPGPTSIRFALTATSCS